MGTLAELFVLLVQGTPENKWLEKRMTNTKDRCGKNSDSAQLYTTPKSGW